MVKPTANNQDHKPPLAIFGFRLRGIIIAVVFLAVLFSLFNPFQLKQSLQTLLKKTTRQQDSNTAPPPGSPGGEIKVTPEMISKAAREVQAERITKYESEQEPSAKIDYYLIRLADGGSIEAESVSIEPERVTVTTTQGIETVIPRKNIRKIISLKLDPKPSQESK